MKKTSLEIKDAKSRLIRRNMEILSLCKKEQREANEDENKEMAENESEIDKLNEEQKALEEELEKEKPADSEDPAEEQKNTRNYKMKSIVSEIRSAMENGTKKFTINAEREMRAVDVTKAATVQGFTSGEGEGAVKHNTTIVEDEYQGILEPLYAKSVLTGLGCRWYTGLPHGNVVIPSISKGSVGWAGEVETAGKSVNEITSVTMTPHRLTAQVVISKELIVTDTIGVENAIRRDIVNALNDKLEATILGAGAKAENKPGGILASGILGDVAEVATFAELCAAEAKVENADFYGNMKYLMNPSAKAKLRAMPKSSKSTQLVLEGGEVDGVGTVVTTNVKNGNGDAVAIYGDFSNLAIGSWGNIEITVDEYTLAAEGCIRLIINSYFDAIVTRKEAFSVIKL